MFIRISTTPPEVGTFSEYTIPEAAALWCGVPRCEIPRILKEAKQVKGPYQYVMTSDEEPNLKGSCIAIAQAIDEGVLRYTKQSLTDPNHKNLLLLRSLKIRASDLKKWMHENYPTDKPSFLFGSDYCIHPNEESAYAYNQLKKELEKANHYLEHATRKNHLQKDFIELVCNHRDQLTAKLEGQKEPELRATRALLNIIGALTSYIRGDVSKIRKHPQFKSESQLITDLAEEYHENHSVYGLSVRNLAAKLPEAKKSLEKELVLQ